MANCLYSFKKKFALFLFIVLILENSYYELDIFATPHLHITIPCGIDVFSVWIEAYFVFQNN
jgi:hypothetical protein